MSDKPENQPAFPGPDDVWMADSPQGGGAWASSYGQAPHKGMTLRNYFAAKVAQGLVSYDNTDTPEWVAARSYRISDAMLAERDKK